jgi:elongation factor 1-gamma
LPTGESAASGDKKKDKAKAAEKAKPEKPARDEEDLDDVPKPSKKDKNPLDELPPTNLVLDNVKRLFSNEEFAVAAPKFWSEYDPEGWSVWQCAYNYNSENRVLFFMTCNLHWRIFTEIGITEKVWIWCIGDYWRIF